MGVITLMIDKFQYGFGDDVMWKFQEWLEPGTALKSALGTA